VFIDDAGYTNIVLCFSVLRYVAQETTLSVDCDSPGYPSKPLQEKEKHLLDKMKVCNDLNSSNPDAKCKVVS